MAAIARIAPTAARIVFGGVFLLFGLNGFFQFLPQPEPGAAAGAFLGALGATGYMFPLIKGVEVVAGVMLLTGRFVPLALVLLAPVVVNIVAFHLVLAPPNAVTFLVLTGELYLAWVYRASFRGVLAQKAAPTVSSDERHLSSGPRRAVA